MARTIVELLDAHFSSLSTPMTLKDALSELSRTPDGEFLQDPRRAASVASIAAKELKPGGQLRQHAEMGRVRPSRRKRGFAAAWEAGLEPLEDRAEPLNMVTTYNAGAVVSGVDLDRFPDRVASALRQLVQVNTSSNGIAKIADLVEALGFENDLNQVRIEAANDMAEQTKMALSDKERIAEQAERHAATLERIIDRLLDNGIINPVESQTLAPMAHRTTTQ